jgi:hypothetical protein
LIITLNYTCPLGYKHMHIEQKTKCSNILTVCFLVFGVFLVSCQTVKPYQRSYLNDSAMKMGLSKGAGPESYAQMIREGASGAGGKNGGGCGCN